MNRTRASLGPWPRVRGALPAGLWLGWCALLAFGSSPAGAATPAPRLSAEAHAMLGRYCLDCHDADVKKGDLDLARLQDQDLPRHRVEWEKVVRRLQTRQMPPAGRKRPSDEEYETVVTRIASALDRVAEANPDPGRTDTLRRLNRTEYRNAIRDLLALDIDAAALLPKDEASHGFDNLAVGDLSPTLLDRYLSAAEKVSRLAIGAPRRVPGGDIYRTRPDLTQEEQVEGLPPGTRGGMLIRHTFPRDGQYEIQIRLTRDRNEHVEGLGEPHELEVLLDRERAALFTVSRPRDDDHDRVDAHLRARLSVTAGPHRLGVTFLKHPSSLLETKRQPYQARYNMHRHPRLGPAVYQVSINGPYDSTGPGDTPSRRRIFTIRPAKAEEDASCAREILATLMRRAYRRPVMDADLERPMEFYRRGSEAEGFEAGIEAALGAVLVSPEFLFRVERVPAGVASGAVYPLDDFALATRLSFFLWSSLPDDELLAAAERGELRDPKALERQARRMLADPRATNLVDNFAEQWLHLRNLDSVTPDLRLFPDFDDNLRQAFRRETSLHFETVRREDRGILDLLGCEHTFLNERLARHYGIPNVYGSRFRRVTLGPGSVRGGLLRQGSVLTVTSYATRTSPVLRGKWILENLLGTPPPPPPGVVPALAERSVSESRTVRERLAAHREDAACAGCHALIDPPGFALENYDAIGRWRTLEDGVPVDARGGLPDGSAFDGVAGLEERLAQRPELFVGAFTEKLLTFALGRGLEPADAPAVRRIVREAKADGYRLSAIVAGIARSVPFTLRKAP